jgi:hypothetical protein
LWCALAIFVAACGQKSGARDSGAKLEPLADAGGVGELDSGLPRDSDAGLSGGSDAGASGADAGAPCISETDEQFCARLNASCDDKSGEDNCGIERFVSCGVCNGPGDYCFNSVCMCDVWNAEQVVGPAECGAQGIACNTIDIQVCGWTEAFDCSPTWHPDGCAISDCNGRCSCENCPQGQACDPWTLECKRPAAPMVVSCEAPLCDARCAQPDRDFHDCGQCDGVCTQDDASATRQLRALSGDFFQNCDLYIDEYDTRGPFWRGNGHVYWAETNRCSGEGAGVYIDSTPFENYGYWTIDYGVPPLMLGGDSANSYGTLYVDGDQPHVGLLALPLAGAPVFELAPVGSPDFLVSDGTTVFWHDSGAFFSIPAVGGVVSTLATTANPPTEVALEEGQVVWMDADSIHLADATGSGSTSVVTGLVHPRNLRVEAGGLYWTTDDAIVSLPTGASEPITLAAGLATPLGFDTDEQSLYWTDSSSLLRKQSLDGGVTATLAHLFAPKQIFVTSNSVVADEWCDDRECGRPGVAEITPK